MTKDHAILTAERNQPGLSRQGTGWPVPAGHSLCGDQEWEERQLELSREELSRIVFDNAPIIQEHMGNDPWVDEPTIDGSARMEAGRVFEQYQDPNDGSMYVGMRCLDGVSGHWLCRNMESPQGSRLPWPPAVRPRGHARTCVRNVTRVVVTRYHARHQHRPHLVSRWKNPSR